MKKICILSLLTAFITAGCSSAADEPPLSPPAAQENSVQEQPPASAPQASALPAQTVAPETDAVPEPEVLAANLEVPWSMAQAGDILYITERTGSIVKIDNGTAVKQRVELKKELADVSEAGLLGLALKPDFAESGLAYAYYTYNDGSGLFNRIVTLRLDKDIWKEEELLLDRIPSGSVHHGGRLGIGPDGKLYATAGDAGEAEIAQERGSLGGKILRLNLDGSVPEDNPFADSYVYSYGHRNAQGLAWTDDGILYASEHGNRSHDEINEIEPGLNYGWPVIEGEEQREGMVTPLFTSGSDTTWAPSGMAYADGRLYAAGLRGSAILAFDLETGEEREVVTGYGRVRDVLIADGMLYFVSNNTDGRGSPQEEDDKLYRVSLSALD
ncbi:MULTISPECIES: PQQ-dependent sugar dehydrogenase [unclassified Paenibacillus]|uniref:PQQ-dependent sugar dehydrogenase n=1 Tax=unclassified Paenibacillus TaxID=185978 RepID=UPI0024067017|nr:MULTISPECIES: PQQ-dependent sugar dehydrogenase [unclassified Paenibacillus]MDF9839306.1 glucose/arabinose dehydrogenase [Paenibacillus sp. PastF-2]MDF9845887.1 glucose/arabinose dehydrogenase [Paenibacillus sp. PastM-2]MDF9852460.1 glucose/arabinose dehydrogenase [Paenibacillus sp. PastF-1]MDH6477810.1 glucose/arabinose dehydrogenase [Paenibacillus sp. PastH-2]MDH6505549.1 glucose/arabinose dehydrogenase [Paenibacillus sp. PastM-3]